MQVFSSGPIAYLAGWVYEISASNTPFQWALGFGRENMGFDSLPDLF